ncbi:PRTRC system protein F [Collimonas sp. H4R21]|uniref:PRTRC system protein F n=1 Tax=Collimonas rhizosphaerae TaxID=3126357 RepID=A0ABU9PXT1_9BURK
MMTASALPLLPADLPTSFRTDGNSRISGPLALAMLRAGLIREDDLHGNDDEKTLVETVLTRWWREMTAPLRLFKWNLHIQIVEHYQFDRNTPVFCISVQKGDIPQRTLALRVEELEAECTGFGQTVVAVLYDSLSYLPEVWSPINVMRMAESAYWGGNADENGWFEDNIGCGEYASREEFLDDVGKESLVTRAELLNGMPDWLPAAKRVCRRKHLERAACSTLGKDVIAACDRIHALAHSSSFSIEPWSFAVDVQADATEACLFLRWNDADSLVRILDDYMHGAYESGEYMECVAATNVSTTPQAVHTYFSNVEAMLLMAKAAEDLLLLISTPASAGDPT